jgi:hypothetical protein
MSIGLRREYLGIIKNRYQNSGKKSKTAILNEFCTNCGYSRKYAIRILNGTVNPLPREHRGRKPKYGPIVVGYLKEIWEAMSRCCSKSLVAALPQWLPHFYSDGITREIEELLLQLSPATVDRLLKPYKKPLRGLSSTQPNLNHKIPIQLLNGEVKEPGYEEGDTVVHCGTTLMGSYANSLTMTDLAVGWTANRAIWGKEAQEVIKQIEDIEADLPFDVIGFASDNGSEFINYRLYKFFIKRDNPIEFVRRRPYKKNDNAHVEQKNWTHVRQLFGYQRIDHPDLIPLMNEIYKNYWNPLRNFFHPCTKLIEKVRIGGRIKKKYDTPKTPYQRLMESPYLSEEKKTMLKQSASHLNPFHLKRELDKKLKIFWDLHKKLNSIPEVKAA